MFDRFTDNAKAVMGLAREEAQRFGHGYIGTEHILSALASQREENAAYQALKLNSFDTNRMRLDIETIVTHGPPIMTKESIPFTPRAKKILELAVQEASELGCDYIGTTHLLLGVIEERVGVGAQVLGRQYELGDFRSKIRALHKEEKILDREYKMGHDLEGEVARQEPSHGDVHSDYWLISRNRMDLKQALEADGYRFRVDDRPFGLRSNQKMIGRQPFVDVWLGYYDNSNNKITLFFDSGSHERIRAALDLKAFLDLNNVPYDLYTPIEEVVRRLREPIEKQSESVEDLIRRLEKR